MGVNAAGVSAGAYADIADGYTTWTTFTTMGSGLNSVFPLSDLSATYAVGVGGVIVKTANGGVTWTADTSPVASTLSNLSLTTALQPVIYGATGTILLYVSTPPDYTGYDLYNGVGTLDSSTLSGHTILRAGINNSTGAFELQVSGASTDPSAIFDTLSVYKGVNLNTRTASAAFDYTDATVTVLGNVTIGATTYAGVVKYVWTSSITLLNGTTTMAVDFDGGTPASKVDFTGTLQWPHLDMGQIGIEKNMIGVDLISDAPTGVTFSVGYDQRDLAKRTAAYAIDADTLPGPLLPMPVSGPSFDLQLNFAAGQAWEHIAANLYVK